jgi:segregation and condensation protein B
MSDIKIKQVVEAAIFAAQDPLTIDKMSSLFSPAECPEKEVLQACLQELADDYVDRGVELIEVASGYRFQARAEYSAWLQRLWQQRPPRYSRALFETLALIAYKQPLTRGEIEEVRGVAVSSQIVKTLMDRGWVRVVGHRDLPGKPALLATTKEFLDYFNLKKLTDLPPLSELMDFDELEKQLGLALPEGMSVEQVQEDVPSTVVAIDSVDNLDNGVEAVESDPSVTLAAVGLKPEPGVTVTGAGTGETIAGDDKGEPGDTENHHSTTAEEYQLEEVL